MGKIIGIDLGTTNSAMAVLEGGKPEIIVNADGKRTTPSVVAWRDGGDRIVGGAALNQQVSNPDNTAYSVKRFIGRAYSDLTDQDLEGLHYKIKKDPSKGRPVIEADGRDILPEEVSAAVLSKLKEDAEKFLGEPVTQAIITVPAYFDDGQRQATKDAGAIAGLEVLRIINEPTAAALAYGYNGDNQTKKILVFDLGGGTFDVSILEVDNSLIQVISTAGDNHLGGDIWDSTFCEYLCKRFCEENGFQFSGTDAASNPFVDSMIHSRVLEAARKAKEDLSTAESVNINLPFLTMNASGQPVHMDYTITRDEFEQVTRELLERCRQPVQEALNGTPENPINLTMNDIDDVLLVGGSTRMPAVQKLITEIYGREANKTVNPDEVVAMGAAVQGGVMNNECKGIVLSDVNSMSLGVKTYPDNMNVMIPANSPIPIEASDVYTNQEAHQKSVEIVVIQGNDPVASSPKNKCLGTCQLGSEERPLPDAGAHQLQIEITMKYDVDGIIHISARELSTGMSLDATIEGTTKLSNNEIKSLAAAEASR